MKTVITILFILTTFTCEANVINQNPTEGTSIPSGSSVDIDLSSDPVAVPSVIGLSQTDATKKINSAGLTVGAITSPPPVSPPCLYYVSNSIGLDTNNGTSQSTPWKTMAKVNSFTFAPGDVTCFKNGDTWNLGLVPSVSGIKGNQIIFQGYDTGNKWLIDGLGTLGRGVAIIEKDYITVDGFYVKDTVENGVLVPHLTDGTVLKNFVIESVQIVGMTVRGQDGLYVNGEIFGTETNVGIGMGGPLEPGLLENNVFDNMWVHNNFKSGITVEGPYTTIKNSLFEWNGTKNGTDSEANGITLLGTTGSIVDNTISRDNGGNGITMLVLGGRRNADNIIKNSEFYNNFGPVGVPGSGIRCDFHTSGTQILNNKSYNNESAGIVYEDWCSDSFSEGNEVYGNARGLTSSNRPGEGNIYKGNNSHDNINGGFESPSATAGIILEGNHFSNNGQSGIDCVGNANTKLIANFVHNNGAGNITNCP